MYARTGRIGYLLTFSATTGQGYRSVPLRHLEPSSESPVLLFSRTFMGRGPPQRTQRAPRTRLFFLVSLTSYSLDDTRSYILPEISASSTPRHLFCYSASRRKEEPAVKTRRPRDIPYVHIPYPSPAGVCTSLQEM